MAKTVLCVVRSLFLVGDMEHEFCHMKIFRSFGRLSGTGVSALYCKFFSLPFLAEIAIPVAASHDGKKKKERKK